MDPFLQASMVTEFKKLVSSFESCLVPRRDKPVKVGIAGTNPVLYNDKKKKVIFDDKGDIYLLINCLNLPFGHFPGKENGRNQQI